MRSSSALAITRASGRIAARRWARAGVENHTASGDIHHPTGHFGAGAEHLGVGVGARDIQKVVVEIEHQCCADGLRVGREPVGGFNIGYREPLGDDDVGCVVEDRLWCRHPDIEAAGDGRMVSAAAAAGCSRMVWGSRHQNVPVR